MVTLRKSGSPGPRKPASSQGCYARDINVPGWLVVETYVASRRSCTVEPSGAEIHVALTNTAPVRYELTIRAVCLSKSLSYTQSGTRRRSVWSSRIVLEPAGNRRNAAHAWHSKEAIYSVHDADDARIRVTVQWKGVNCRAGGTTDPIVLCLCTSSGIPKPPNHSPK